MALSIFLGIWNEDKLRRVKVDDVDLDSNVEILRPHLTKELGENPDDDFELTFCGFLLDDKKPLSSYGVTAGVTIHVIEKLKPKQSAKCEPPKINEAFIQELASSYRSFRASPSFRTTLHRLENPTDLDKIISAVPGLQDDPMAIAFISKPDILTQLEDPKTCWKIAERNPTILLAVRYIITEFHKTTPVSGTAASFQPPPSSGHSYSLDALSDDDDDMEGDGPSSGGGITAAHLAAALAAAAGGGSPSASRIGSMITPAMLQDALTPAAGGTGRYATQLRQMRDLGLNDEGRNVRALTAAGGDLQAAIDLIFSGALDD
ncbi:ubiquitin-like protein 7 [Anthonomus grandis grandis]|uniref:ubiquitin-like protein 7 n=1 Tax=Anthonomus grandis grandis TaxID=2921223 RepID=UPI00216622C5|nr:ubiquitin-like protein 7 [Anthonomus grandis grandis]